METFKKFLKDLLTETDNSTFDISKLLAACSVISAIYFQWYDLSTHPTTTHFDIQQYGIGIAALFAGIAAALHLKKDTPTV